MEISPLADHQNFINELAELHHIEWGHLHRSFTLEKRIEAISQAAGREGIPSVFIAASEGQLIGSAALVHQDMTTRPDLSPWLAAVYVKKDFRHQGIASELIARCENEAVRAGAGAWYLYTEFASGLYEKLGWQPMEHCKNTEA
ncbi:MAG: GNAT family N-acetyltransferase [Chromatocurvus sp.]